MSSNFTVIYDACVLYPAPLRDLLMRLALTDLYRARWTDLIHDEWTRNVLKQRPDLKAEEGIGPKFLKLCGRVLYRQVDIEAYEESCLATSTKNATAQVSAG